MDLNTLDQYCAQNEIHHVDLMKIDAEGHELAVIEGARSMLEAHKVSVVPFEYNHCWIESRQYLLLPRGYFIVNVTPRGIEFDTARRYELESSREGNDIACLKEWASRFPSVESWNSRD